MERTAARVPNSGQQHCRHPVLPMRRRGVVRRQLQYPGRMIHHDGMNYALYRIAKDRSEAERIADKIYSGEIDEVGFRKRTRSSIRMSPIFTAGRSGAASCTLESGTRDLEIPQPSEGCVAVFCTQIGAILLYQTVCLTLSRRPGYPFIAHTPFPFLSASPCTRFASRLFILRN